MTTIDGKGDNALQLLREEFDFKELSSLHNTQYKSILEALKRELAKTDKWVINVPPRGHKQYLMQIMDGTYPRERAGGTGGNEPGGSSSQPGGRRSGDPGGSGSQPSARRVAGGGGSSSQPRNSGDDSNSPPSIETLLQTLVAGQTSLAERMEALERERRDDGTRLERGDRGGSSRREEPTVRAGTLAAMLSQLSGGAIRVRGGDNEELDEESDGERDGLLESLEFNPSRNREKKAERRFWEDFRKTHFPVQTLSYPARDGSIMLKRALTNYPTVSAFVQSKTIKQERNAREAEIVAKVLDCLIDEMGIMTAKDSKATEVLMRRLAGILQAENTGSWEEADLLCHEGGDLLDLTQRSRLRKAVKLAREARKKPVPEGGLGEK